MSITKTREFFSLPNVHYARFFKELSLGFSNIKKNKVFRKEGYKNKAMEVTEAPSAHRATELVCQFYYQFIYKVFTQK